MSKEQYRKQISHEDRHVWIWISIYSDNKMMRVLASFVDPMYAANC